MDSLNYYKLLEVDENASPEDIKKSFRKLSMKYHPDVAKDNPEAEEKFKQINTAYSTLSNPEKRRQYDNPNPFNNLFGVGQDPIFGGIHPFMNRQSLDPNRPRKGVDLRIPYDVNITTLIFGGVATIQIGYNDVCESCFGKGFSEVKTCPNCNGSGTVMHMSQQGNMRMHSTVPCGACRGRGEIGITACTICNGSGTKAVELSKDIEITRNTNDGTILTYPGEGGKGINGGPPGDLYIKLYMTVPMAEEFTEEQKEQLIMLLGKGGV